MSLPRTAQYIREIFQQLSREPAAACHGITFDRRRGAERAEVKSAQRRILEYIYAALKLATATCAPRHACIPLLPLLSPRRLGRGVKLVTRLLLQHRVHDVHAPPPRHPQRRAPVVVGLCEAGARAGEQTQALRGAHVRGAHDGVVRGRRAAEHEEVARARIGREEDGEVSVRRALRLRPRCEQHPERLDVPAERGEVQRCHPSLGARVDPWREAPRVCHEARGHQVVVAGRAQHLGVEQGGHHLGTSRRGGVVERAARAAVQVARARPPGSKQEAHRGGVARARRQHERGPRARVACVWSCAVREEGGHRGSAALVTARAAVRGAAPARCGNTRPSRARKMERREAHAVEERAPQRGDLLAVAGAYRLHQGLTPAPAPDARAAQRGAHGAPPKRAAPPTARQRARAT